MGCEPAHSFSYRWAQKLIHVYINTCESAITTLCSNISLRHSRSANITNLNYQRMLIYSFAFNIVYSFPIAHKWHTIVHIFYVIFYFLLQFAFHFFCQTFLLLMHTRICIFVCMYVCMAVYFSWVGRVCISLRFEFTLRQLFLRCKFATEFSWYRAAIAVGTRKIWGLAKYNF